MMKFTCYCLIWLSFSVIANDLTEASHIESTRSEIPRIETLRPLLFPRIELNEASQRGFRCFANNRQNPSKHSLCPGKTGQSMLLQIRGDANAMVNLQYSVEQHSQALMLTLHNPPRHLVLSATGIRDIEIAAAVELVNKNAVQGSKISWQYGLAVVYQ